MLPKWLRQILNRFFERSKEATRSQKIDELEGHVEDLTQQIGDLRVALIKTQNVLGDVCRAQSEFMLEFETLIRIAQAAQTQLESEWAIEKKEDPDVWN